MKDPVTTYDLHATVLHLLGLDNERLTFYNDGIRHRLTNVHGRVARAILAWIGPAFASLPPTRRGNLRHGTADLERRQRTTNPSIVPLANLCREGYA